VGPAEARHSNRAGHISDACRATSDSVGLCTPAPAAKRAAERREPHHKEPWLEAGRDRFLTAPE
jgi:hypothetical protein